MVTDMRDAGAMPKGLRVSLSVIDYGMLLYWSISALSALGIIRLSGEYMYAGYGDPMMGAWNWSFAPLDIIFAITGLYAVKLARRGDARWHSLALISLSLTFCAGLMAIAFWAIIGFFDLSWWLPNVLLMVIPAFWMVRLLAENSANP